MLLLDGTLGGVVGFEWESTLLNDLLLFLNPVSLTDAEDSWCWRPDEGKTFTVKSAYEIVSDMLLPKGNLSTAQELSFKVLWKCLAPSKVSGFAWLVLLDRVPTVAYVCWCCCVFSCCFPLPVFSFFCCPCCFFFSYCYGMFLIMAPFVLLGYLVYFLC
jgi:hypothetical protein